jgi:hypothetical protein
VHSVIPYWIYCSYQQDPIYLMLWPFYACAVSALNIIINNHIEQ